MLYILCLVISTVIPLIAAELLLDDASDHATTYEKVKQSTYNNYYTRNPPSDQDREVCKPTYAFTTTQSFLRNTGAEAKDATTKTRTITTKSFTLTYTISVHFDARCGKGKEYITCTTTFTPRQHKPDSFVQQLHDQHYVPTLSKLTKDIIGRLLRKHKVLAP